MATTNPPDASKSCLFIIFHNLVKEIHDANVTGRTNCIFLSMALKEAMKESPPSAKSNSDITAWFDRTVDTIQQVMKDFLQDSRFAYLIPEEDIDGFFEIFSKSCRRILSRDQKHTLLFMLGKLLFWSCLDESCYHSIVQSFLRLNKAERDNAQGVASSSDQLKWNLLHHCFYSIENSMKHIFKKVQRSMKPRGLQPQLKSKTNTARFLVSVLITNDIIKQSILFFSEIGPSRKCKLPDVNLKSRGNMCILSTHAFFSHINDEDPDPLPTSLKQITDIFHFHEKGRDWKIESIHTGLDIYTYAKTVGLVGSNENPKNGNPTVVLKGDDYQNQHFSDRCAKDKENTSEICPNIGTTSKMNPTVSSCGVKDNNDPSVLKSGDYQNKTVSDEGGKDKDSQTKIHRGVVNGKSIHGNLKQWIEILTKDIPKDFKLLEVGCEISSGAHTENVKDQPGLKCFTALLMIVKQYSSSIGGIILEDILSRHLKGQACLATGPLDKLLLHLREKTNLLKFEFMAALMDSDLNVFSSNRKMWKIHFPENLRALEGNAVTRDPRRSPRKKGQEGAKTNVQTEPEASANTNANKDKNKKNKKRPRANAKGRDKAQKGSKRHETNMTKGKSTKRPKH